MSTIILLGARIPKIILKTKVDPLVLVHASTKAKQSQN